MKEVNGDKIYLGFRENGRINSKKVIRFIVDVTLKSARD